MAARAGVRLRRIVTNTRRRESSLRMKMNSSANATEPVVEMMGWDEIENQTESPPSLLREARENGRNGYVEGKRGHIVLYRDSAGWCPYCEKVQLFMEVLGVPYKTKTMPLACYGEKPSSYYRIQPGGMLPAAIVFGGGEGEDQVLQDSGSIMMHVEAKYGSQEERGKGGLLSRLPPSGFPGGGRKAQLLRLEREFFSAWLSWLTGYGGRANFEKVLTKVEKELEKNTSPFFFGGEEIGFVDCTFAPMLERANASLLYYKNFRIRSKHPNLERWFEAMEKQVPAYQGLVADFYNHAHTLPPQLGGCISEDDTSAKIIDGSSWKLPLPLLEEDTFEPYAAPCSEEKARRWAANCLARNHGNIVAFACRGAGSTGKPGVRARLSDPNAMPNLEYKEQVGTCLLAVGNLLLNGKAASGDPQVAVDAMRGIPNSRGLVSCLEYIRDRVGVPRDMPYPAARQLRAHLNFAIQGLSSR